MIQKCDLISSNPVWFEREIPLPLLVETSDQTSIIPPSVAREHLVLQSWATGGGKIVLVFQNALNRGFHCKQAVEEGERERGGRRASHDLPLSRLCNNGQPGELAKEAGRRAIDERDQQEEEDGAVQAHHQVQPHPFAWGEAPLEQIREDEEHVEDDGLHGVEADEPAEAPRVSHHGEVEREEDEEPVEGEPPEQADGGNEGLQQHLEGRELGDDILTVLDPVEEGVEVAGRSDEPVRRPDGVAAVLLGPQCAATRRNQSEGGGGGIAAAAMEELWRRASWRQRKRTEGERRERRSHGKAARLWRRRG